MAKISARGAREAARWEAFRTLDGDTYRLLYVLRTDGKLLRRVADGGSYSIVATTKATGDVAIAQCERWIQRRCDRMARLAAR